MNRVRIEEGTAGRKNDSLRINFSQRKAKGEFMIHQFMDHGHFVAYIPSLNLSAYGDSEQEAVDRLLNEVFDDFMENIVALGPEGASKELKQLGWLRNKIFKKQFSSNAYVDRDGILKNFNLPEETPIKSAVVTV